MNTASSAFARLTPPRARVPGTRGLAARKFPRGRTGRTALVADAVTVLLLLAPLLAAAPAMAQQGSEELLNRVSNPKLQAYEEQLTGRINTELARYIGKNQYVLSVKVVWNPEVIPVVQNPALSQDKQKLPGFPIFVRAPDTPNVEESTPSFSRLTVRVLLDETLPEYYERFVRKLVPIVARFDSSRGDQVVVVKETFPFLNREQQPPTLPEKELMSRLGQQPQGVSPSGEQAAAAPELAASPREAVQVAFDEGRYPDALRAAQAGFQKATANQERAQFLAMEGSILFTMNNRDAARSSWRRALTFDPTNVEISRMLQFLDAQAGAAPGGTR